MPPTATGSAARRPPGAVRAVGLIGVLLTLVATGCSERLTSPERLADCRAERVVRLEPGEAARFSGPDAGQLCIQADAPSDYALVISSLSDSDPGIRAVTVTADGVAHIGDLSRTVDASRTAYDARSAVQLERSTTGPAAHLWIRTLEQRELGPRSRDDAPIDLPGPLRRMELPSEGDSIQLNARTDSACEAPDFRNAVVKVVSANAIVVEDPRVPAGGFTEAHFRSFAADFDTLVAPLAQEAFGKPTDLDDNGRVILYFTGEVNRLSQRTSGPGLRGLFFARDLFPRIQGSRLQPCAGSNGAELLYFMVPDPDRALGFGTPTRENLIQSMPRSMIHEMQHLIGASRRLHITRASDPFEVTWLNEALSHTAEDLLFFRATGLGPRMNIGSAEILEAGPRGRPALEWIHAQNLRRFHRYLRAPEAHSPFAEVDGIETRGAAYQLLRYLLDRSDRPGAELLAELIDSDRAGRANLAARFGGENALRDQLADWHVALFADDRIEVEDPAHRLPSWNYPSLFTELEMSGAPYPLRAHAMDRTAPLAIEIAGGSAAFLDFSVPSPRAASVEVTTAAPSPGALDSSWALTLLRTR